MTDQSPRHRGAAAASAARDGRDAATREHDALLAGVRHELRTPLNAVLGYSELLMEDATADGYDALLPELRAIRGMGGDLLALVEHLLDPARDGAPAPPDPAALQGALRSALQAPAEQLCGESARLLAAATASGQSALLPDLQRIQAAATHILALSADTSAVAAAPAPDSVAATPVGSMATGVVMQRAVSTILVVDDQAVNRDLLARRLGREGHAVTVAEDGGQALKLVADGHFDLVLLDVLMPGLDGYAVLERLKADPATRDIPVIMISALDEFDSAVRCIELGAEDYLPKPFDPTLLRARIGASLDKKRLRDQERAHLLAIEARDAELAAWNRTLEERVHQQVEELERLGRLRRFLSPQLAEVIVAQGDESLLASHRREITAAYCALRGFAAFAEAAQPEDVMGVLGEYHAALGPLVFAHEGTLERFAGDGMMVCFNDPVPCPDPAWRAVQMTVAMRERADELSRRWLRRGHELDLVAGIAVGYATCGRIGFEGRFDYAAIGTVTNLATRLCDRALPGQILLSSRAHAEVEGRVVSEPVDALPMEGAGRLVPVFNVIGMVSPPQVDAAPVPAGLSAREVEVLRLVAEGLTDAQVAERLFLSTRTINQHLRSIYNKLGVSTRAAATRFAIEHGLA